VGKALLAIAGIPLSAFGIYTLASYAGFTLAESAIPQVVVTSEFKELTPANRRVFLLGQSSDTAVFLMVPELRLQGIPPGGPNYLLAARKEKISTIRVVRFVNIFEEIARMGAK
jgi:hypothetical protein